MEEPTEVAAAMGAEAEAGLGIEVGTKGAGWEAEALAAEARVAAETALATPEVGALVAAAAAAAAVARTARSLQRSTCCGHRRCRFPCRRP